MRVSMAALVGRVRALVDSYGPSDFRFSDDQIQDALDQHRCEYRYLELAPLPTKTSSSTTYLNFKAPIGDWDTATVLYDNDFDAQSPATSDYINGRWTFSAEPTRPITLVGFTYDRYAAAADLLEQMVISGDLDAAKLSAINGTIANYRGRQRAESRDMIRDDIWGAGWQ